MLISRVEFDWVKISALPTPNQNLFGTRINGNKSNLIQAYKIEHSLEEARANIRAEMEEDTRNNTVVADVLEPSQEAQWWIYCQQDPRSWLRKTWSFRDSFGLQ